MSDDDNKSAPAEHAAQPDAPHASESTEDALVQQGRRRLLRMGVYVTPTILSMTALSSPANAQQPTVSIVAPVRVLSRIAAATRARARTRARTGGTARVTARSRVAGATSGRGGGSR